MEKGIIDRFEGELAVVEFDNEMRDIPTSQLPKNANVGDVLIFDGNKITIDQTSTKQLADEIEALANELFED